MLNPHLWAFSICVLAVMCVVGQILIFGGMAELYTARTTAPDSDALTVVDETIAMQRDFLSTGIWLSLIVLIAAFAFFALAGLSSHYQHVRRMK